MQSFLFPAQSHSDLRERLGTFLSRAEPEAEAAFQGKTTEGNMEMLKRGLLGSETSLLHRCRKTNSVPLDTKYILAKCKYLYA